MKPGRWLVRRKAASGWWSVSCPFDLQDCRCGTAPTWQEAILHVNTTNRLMREAGKV